MAEALILGAAVGAVYAEIQKQIIEAIKTAAEFKSIFERINETIRSIEPMIRDIEKSDKALERPQDCAMYVDLLTKGKDLIIICSKVKSREVINRYVYAKKLKGFEADLTRIFQVNMQAQQTVQLMQILAIVRDGTGVCAAPDPPRYIIGLDLPLEELKAVFLEDHMEGSMIAPKDSLSLTSMELPEVVVLSALPGCGKTTLAQMLCHDETIKGIYKHIFFVPVSKTGNIKVIVQRIYRHKGYQLPQIVDNHDAIFQLSLLFKKLGPAPILLVLDDVWSPGLESLVCEFMIEGIPQYKILVTSRFEPPAFRPTTYKLNSLKFEDAKDLFCHSAALPKPGTGHAPVSDELVNEIVKACKGFPLALDLVGLSLKGQPYWTWKQTLNKWSTGQSNIFDDNSELLLARLTTSLDALDEDKSLATAKECFLDLASFPEDQRIPAAALMDMWVELYRFDEDGISTLANLSILADRNLVRFEPKRKDESYLGGFCHEEFVTLHDMLRELAIHQCSKEPIPRRKRLIMEINEDELSDNWIDSIREHLLDARLVSISTDDSFTSNWYDMQLPEVKVLVLNFQSKDYSLPEFVKAMAQLKVLIITNYGFAAAEVNDLPLIEHISSLRRIRLEHISISSLGSSALQLRNLKKISLIMCEIGAALNECAKMFPYVIEIEIDCCPDLVQLPDELCKLIHLKKLSITSCNELSELPRDIGKLKNLKVLRLNSCTKLEELPESIGDLQKLNFLDISDCLSITRMPTRMGELRSLRTLNMRGCRGLIFEELPTSVEELQKFTVIGDEQTIALWQDYDNVEVIEVKEDPSLDWLHKPTSFNGS